MTNGHLNCSLHISYNMYLELLISIGTLAFILLLSNLWLARRIYRMDEHEQKTAWGGLDEDLYFRIWCVTYVLSSVGLCSTFYLYLFFSSQLEALVIFVLMHIALISFNFVMVSKNVVGVVVCIFVIFFCYVVLWIHTLVSFPVDHRTPDILLYVTHFCNGVCVIHSLILDVCIWYPTWSRNVGIPYMHVDSVDGRGPITAV
jgi:hypothetical protein